MEACRMLRQVILFLRRIRLWKIPCTAQALVQKTAMVHRLRFLRTLAFLNSKVIIDDTSRTPRKRTSG